MMLRRLIHDAAPQRLLKGAAHVGLNVTHCCVTHCSGS